MSKITKIYLVFFLIFLIGTLGVYLYLKLLLNQQVTHEIEAVKGVNLVSTLFSSSI